MMKCSHSNRVIAWWNKHVIAGLPVTGYLAPNGSMITGSFGPTSR
jgi:hypothetical protein